ncbi:MAG: TadE/TadG family type IV pilus assembly protein [Desertimonas sp.]
MGDCRWRRGAHRSPLQRGDRRGDRQDLNRRPRRGRGERGQAAVELALVLPLVVLFLCGVIEVALVGRDQLALELSARAAARAASVSASPSAAATNAAQQATALRPLDVSTRTGGDTVTVTVRHRHDPSLPMIGPLLAGVDLSASATMAWEPP